MSTLISTILWITWKEGTGLLPGLVPAAAAYAATGLVDLPGASELQTPCLITTHKIRQITANFTGISNVIQSIIPSLSTCTSRHLLLPGTSWICQQEIRKIKWRKSAILRHLPWCVNGIARRVLISPKTKSQKIRVFIKGVWELTVRAPGAG